MWVGRTAELEAVRRAVSEGSTVVTGPPGIGKTALLERLAEGWPGEVIRCDLGERSTPGSIVDAVASALDIGADRGAAIGAALAARPGALLILDGAERAGTALVELIERWAPPAVVVGSRIRLDLDRTIALGPLPVDDAVTLFLASARRLVSGPLDQGQVETLVRALDGVPLAVLVAASRVRTVGLDDPALLGAVARSGPLAAAVGASIDALDEEARRALGRVTLFEGVFDAAGFRTVGGASDEVLEWLVDASLVGVTGPGRLHLLRVVRHLAAERWDEADRAEVRARWASWVREAADRAARTCRSTGRTDDYEALRGDLRALAPTHAWAGVALLGLHLQRGPLVDPTLGTDIPAEVAPRLALLRARLAGRRLAHADALQLLEAWGTDGVIGAEIVIERLHHLVALDRLDEARALLPEVRRASSVDPERIARARLAEAVFHRRLGDLDRAVEVLREGLAAIGTEPLPDLRARTFAHLGAMLRTIDPPAAEEHLRRALEAATQCGDVRREGVVAQWLGLLLADRGELDEAAELLIRSARRCASVENAPFVANAATYLCQVRLEQGRPDDAREALAPAMEVTAATAVSRATALGHRSLILHFEDDTAAAVPIYEQVVGELERLGRGAMAASWRAFLALADPSRPGGCGDPALDRLLEAARGGGVDPGLREEARSWGRADARLLLMLSDRSGVTCTADGSTFVLRDGSRVDLSRRPLLVRLVRTLVEAGAGGTVGRGALMEAVWPGERLVGRSGDARLHVAISTLRKQGVPLVTTEVDGELAYALEADVRIVG